jgi:hypothetical protein
MRRWLRRCKAGIWLTLWQRQGEVSSLRLLAVPVGRLTLSQQWQQQLVLVWGR